MGSVQHWRAINCGIWGTTTSITVIALCEGKNKPYPAKNCMHPRRNLTPWGTSKCYLTGDLLMVIAKPCTNRKPTLLHPCDPQCEIPPQSSDNPYFTPCWSDDRPPNHRFLGKRRQWIFKLAKREMVMNQPHRLISLRQTHGELGGTHK